MRIGALIGAALLLICARVGAQDQSNLRAEIEGIKQQLAQMDELKTRLAALEKKPLAQTTLIYDRNGRLIAQVHGATDRVVVGSGQIPVAMKHAAVAIEDKRFYTNHGVDFQTILRAALADLRAGSLVQGGSTIAMQYV